MDHGRSVSAEIPRNNIGTNGYRSESPVTDSVACRLGDNRTKALIKPERYQETETVVTEPMLATEIQALGQRAPPLAVPQGLPAAFYPARTDDLFEWQ
jgi:hypothetical protein